MITWLPQRVLPVLMYHRLGRADSDDADPNLWIPQRSFEQHLDWLASAGFRTLTLDRAYEALLERRVPRGQVLLTFDDAFAETLELAQSLLAARDMHAAVFVASETVGRTVSFAPIGKGDSCPAGSRGLVADRRLLRDWHAAGHGIGAHAASHVALDRLPAAELDRETRGAKATLEDHLGVPVLDFCYPYARHDEAARRQVEAAGFRAAYAGEPPRMNLYSLPRMMVFPSDGHQRYRRKLSGYYYFLAAWHRRLQRALGRA